jgi:hypothetical protein
LSDSTDRPNAGPHVLVVRAAFVPDGEQPPPEFSSDFNSLHIRATLDTSTGQITCDGAGVNFDGDIRAEWHPDHEQDSEDGDGPAGVSDEDPPDETNSDSDT